MAYQRPTFSQIVTRIEADMSSRLLGGAPVLRRSFLGVLARVFAGAMHLCYGFLVWISKQIVPGSDNDSDYLEKHADDFGVTRRAASYASGNVTLSGTNGATIPAGTLVQRSDAVQYQTLAEGTISTGTATVAVQAVVSGVNGNVDAATSLQLVSTITGINTAAVVASGGMTGGVDQESDAELLARLLTRMQNQPQGGAKIDYEIWAKEVAGVSRAWCFPTYDYDNDVYPAPGHVGVTFMTSSGIPSGSLVTQVQNYLQDSNREGKAPCIANVKAYAPEALPVSFEIHISPDTPGIRAAVRANIAALFESEGAPNSTIPLSHIEHEIKSAAGLTDYQLISPASAVVTTRKQYPVPDVDNINFQPL
jgi:uncharacterized phage protein gp47/JayE